MSGREVHSASDIGTVIHQKRSGKNMQISKTLTHLPPERPWFDLINANSSFSDVKHKIFASSQK